MATYFPTSLLPFSRSVLSLKCVSFPLVQLWVLTPVFAARPPFSMSHTLRNLRRRWHISSISNTLSWKKNFDSLRLYTSVSPPIEPLMSSPNEKEDERIIQEDREENLKERRSGGGSFYHHAHASLSQVSIPSLDSTVPVRSRKTSSYIFIHPIFQRLKKWKRSTQTFLRRSSLHRRLLFNLKLTRRPFHLWGISVRTNWTKIPYKKILSRRKKFILKLGLSNEDQVVFQHHFAYCFESFGLCVL